MMHRVGGHDNSGESEKNEGSLMIIVVVILQGARRSLKGLIFYFRFLRP